MRLIITPLVFALVSPIGAQELPTIRVPVRLVTVPTLVFSRDSRLLPDLKTTDFRVLDNGRLQSVTLNTSYTPVSVAVVIQLNQDVREYVPFIARSGNALDALLVGESGESAVLTYSSEVTVVKPFATGDLQSALKSLSAGGRQARMVDAGMRALTLLSARPRLRTRVLVFIGQPMDSGSESTLAALRDRVEKENVTVYALALPELGKTFVSDTFSLQGLSSRADRGGFKAGADLGKLVPVLNRTANAANSADPFSVLTGATGGTQLHFRKQRQLEDAIADVGIQLRTAYQLSYYPSSIEFGYHTVKVEVDIPDAKVYSRPGYWLGAN